MSSTIKVKPGDLNSRMLKKAISSLKKANSALMSYSYMRSYDNLADVYYTCYGTTKRLFSNATTDMLPVPADLQYEVDELERLAGILGTGPDGFDEIDRSFRKDIKSWRRSGKHNKVLWTSSGGATGGATKITPKNARTEIRINSYPDGVKKGEIRWVDQTGSTENRKANGWGDNHGYSGWQCNSACESMALSYLGIDRSPGEMVPSGGDEIGGLEVANYGTGTREWGAPDGSTIIIENHAYCDMEDIDRRIENFCQDGNQGNTAPVMIRYGYPNDKYGGHWLLITGKNPDGTYNAIGPATESEKGTTVTISPDGTISGSGISQGGGKIQRYAQYKRK